LKYDLYACLYCMDIIHIRTVCDQGLLLLVRAIGDRYNSIDILRPAYDQELRGPEAIDPNSLGLKIPSALFTTLVDVYTKQDDHRDGAESKEEGEGHVVIARAVDDGTGNEGTDEGACALQV
jgi:hypothetical protein